MLIRNFWKKDCYVTVCVHVYYSYLLPIHGWLHLLEGGLKFSYEVMFAIRIPVPYCTLKQEKRVKSIKKKIT